MKLQPGVVVRTSYGTGPYCITSVYGPCACPRFLDSISLREPPASELHYHLLCEDADRRGGAPYHLNGYRPDGTNVWDSDYLVFEGVAEGVSGDLFAPEAA